jgi:hypothetical protein
MTTTPSHPLAVLGDLSPQVYLLIAPRPLLRELTSAAAAYLALKHSVRIIDAGNLFNTHAVARLVRRVVSSAEPGSDPLQRIRISRAFTCYQVETRLRRLEAGLTPLLILDLLATFADENAPLLHRSYLMEQIMHHLERLGQQSPVLVSLTPAADPPLDLYQRWLAHVAGRILHFEPKAPPSSQPTLF